MYCSGELASDVYHDFFFNDTATTEIYTLSLHDALPIFACGRTGHGHDVIRGRPSRERVKSTPPRVHRAFTSRGRRRRRSEEHTSELQSRQYLVCRLLLEKKKQMREWLKADKYRIGLVSV